MIFVSDAYSFYPHVGIEFSKGEGFAALEVFGSWAPGVETSSLTQLRSMLDCGICTVVEKDLRDDGGHFE